MKTKLLLFAALFAVSFQFTNAQCSRSGTFVQSDPAYSISGTGNITFTTSGTKEVIFEADFATVQGADLRVYLSKTDDILATNSDALEVSVSPLENDAGGFGGPGVSPITGMMSFTIPAAANAELDTYNYIVIQCIIINERWGHVTLGANTGPDCNVLSVEENTLLNAVNFHPNPASDVITVNNDKQLELSIEVYNVLGKKVLQTKNSSLRKQTINLSSLKTGVYLTQIKAGGNSITKKLVKQ
ncbi:T9SS type A sorting domain-containing protein [uncultured Lacinutrix sp.]|uniref:T9SS type A sorting domain-containing protein n=1 Tax=uncultured Lacinutrix sp. TaxID=574032 RepID=UPI0026056EB9|nr:T9SS type A sorting domain-containing protein [uncultured Lacinutrix sp.]